MAERLLDDDARVLCQACLGEALDDRAEEERRDLEVEDRQLASLDRVGHVVECHRVGEVALDVGEPFCEAVEHLPIEGLAGPFDALARMVAQVVDRPVVDRHSHDRAAKQPTLLQPIERPERHYLCQVAGDSEHNQHVGLCEGTCVSAACAADCSRVQSGLHARRHSATS